MLNESLVRFTQDYLFAKIAKKAKEAKGPLLHLGIGDIKEPLAPSIAIAIENAAKELSTKNPGYGPASGYDFLKEKIKHTYYENLEIETDEIFISDGAKTDSSNITHLFSNEIVYGICDPVYPVYLASNQIMGKTNLVTIPLKKENNFLPKPPNTKCDIVYLCSPNNPTGIAYDKETLQAFVDWAIENQTVIIFDGAYADFITEKDKVRSIFEIEGAKKVAIEMRSFSKSAGFTALRTSYTIISKECMINGASLHELWQRRLAVTYNGTSYLSQKAALATLQDAGKEETKKQRENIMQRAKRLKNALQNQGVYGGVNCPYIWMQIPDSFNSWQYFDYLLNEFGIICTPGSGFGEFGEGFVRFSAFGSDRDIDKAIELLKRSHATTH